MRIGSPASGISEPMVSALAIICAESEPLLGAPTASTLLTRPEIGRPFESLFDKA